MNDLAEGCLFIMDRYSAGEIGELINIGTGEDLTIRDLAEMVRRIVGYTGSVGFDPSKPDGTPRKLLDVSKVQALGWKPSIPLKQGIADTYRWYLDTVRA